MNLKRLNLELFADCESVDDVRASVIDEVETYYGHIVNSLSEAAEWLSSEDTKYDMYDVHYGESVKKVITLNSDENISVRIQVTEWYVDSGSSDYCYNVEVDEWYY